METVTANAKEKKVRIIAETINSQGRRHNKQNVYGGLFNERNSEK